MSGCPEGSIFDSGVEIENGIREFGGKTMTGTVTKILREDSVSQPSEVLSVVEVDVGDGRTIQIRAKRIYLAAGPIGTPLILQKSGLAPSMIEVRDSQMFYSAFFAFDPFDSNSQSMATSQGYFSTKPGVSREQEFSMSVYEHSIDFRTRLEQMVPKLIKPLIRLLNPITQRIVPGIGFLSQDVSGTIRLNFDGQRTSVELCQSQTAKGAIKSARKRLRRTSRFLGLIQLPNPFRNPTVGAGFHAGASMPMGEKSDSLVDWSGKLKALPSVRIVDASSLMRIKAGSHTFMAMANAHRIASNVE
jgi:choline dehydrogenase-like flavoprotein